MDTMMLIKEALDQFNISHNEESKHNLCKHIQELVEAYNSSVDYCSSYFVLAEILGDITLPCSVISNTLTLLDKFASQYSRKNALKKIVLPCLSHQITYRYRQQPNDSLIRKCLRSLINTVCDEEIHFISSYTKDLILILTKILLKSRGSSLQDDALTLLAVLSRNNPLIQGVIKSQDSIRSLYTHLMKLFSSDNIEVVVYALSLFTTLCLNEELGDKIFVGSASETIILVHERLNFVTDRNIKLCCLNLLIDFTRSHKMISALTQTSLLDDIINNHLIDEEPIIRNKVCDLLIRLSVKDGNLRNQILDLLTPDIIRYMISSVSLKEDSTPELRSNDASTESLPIESQIPVMQFITMFLPQIWQHCDIPIFFKQLIKNIERIIDEKNNPEVCTVVALSCQCYRIMLENHQLPAHLDTDLNFNAFNILSQLLDNITVFPSPKKEFIEAVLAIATVCSSYGTLPDSFSHANLSMILAQAMVSGDVGITSTAISLLTLISARKSEIFQNGEDFAARMFRLGEIVSHSWSVAEHRRDKLEQEHNALKQEYSDLQMKSYNAMSANDITPQSQSSSQISDLITELRDGLHIGDVKTSQLLEIFQEKISIMVSKEEQLMELVEAKNAALQQNDRMFSQFKNRIQLAEKECSKYRLLLQEAETAAESSREEICAINNDRNHLLEEVERLKEEVAESSRYQEKYTATREEVQVLSDKLSAATALNSELADKLEGLKEEIDILKVHNETLKSQHESDVTQVQVLQKEKQKVVTKLEEKDSLYLKTKQTLRQSEEKNRKKEKEKQELEAQLSKMRSDLAKTESKYKEILEKEKCLESKVAEKDKLIAVQRAEVEGKNEEIEKYSKLMAMFHNLSSGKPGATTQR